MEDTKLSGWPQTFERSCVCDDVINCLNEPTLFNVRLCFRVNWRASSTSESCAARWSTVRHRDLVLVTFNKNKNKKGELDYWPSGVFPPRRPDRPAGGEPPKTAGPRDGGSARPRGDSGKDRRRRLHRASGSPRTVGLHGPAGRTRRPGSQRYEETNRRRSIEKECTNNSTVSRTTMWPNSLNQQWKQILIFCPNKCPGVKEKIYSSVMTHSKIIK